MNEKDKLEEAQYFYSRMVVEHGKRGIFKHNLSAFLSAARSVMQYANEEAKTKNGGQRWYDDLMNSSDVLSFFKDKRDLNIHTSPTDPRPRKRATVTVILHVLPSEQVKVTDKNGKVKEEREIKEEPKPRKAPKTSARSKLIYVFDDWTGSEDLITLCKMYIEELENVVQDGISKGFIAG